MFPECHRPCVRRASQKQQREGEHAFFEYRALSMSTPYVEEKGEPVHCLIKVDIAAQNGRIRRGAELEQEAGNLILFLINPGPHRRISHSTIC
jgi:hypothetical protein